MESKELDDGWYVLAGLRFILASCVLITHSGIVAPDSLLFDVMGHTGYPAVFGFFMISGYSIAASITAQKSGYFMRRVRRIYPALIFAIFVSVLTTCFKPLSLPLGQVIYAPKIGMVTCNILMLQGTLCNALPQNGALWSLSIEWWLYILAPVLIAYHNRYTILLGLMSFAAMCMYYSLHGYVQNLANGLNLPFLSWEWLFGFAVYRSPKPFTFLLLVLPPLILFNVYIPLDFASVVILASAITLLLAPSIKINHPGIKAVLNYLGNASYPLYLLQSPLLYALTVYTPMRHGQTLIITVMAVVLSGYMMVRWVWAEMAHHRVQTV